MKVAVKLKTVVVVPAVVALIVLAGAAIHNKMDAEYWQKQYDQEKRAVGAFPVITILKTCIDRNGSEWSNYTPSRVSVAPDTPAQKVPLDPCPNGTVDAQVYIGRR